MTVASLTRPEAEHRAALLAVNSTVNQNYDLLLYTAAGAALLGAVIVLPIKKVK